MTNENPKGRAARRKLGERPGTAADVLHTVRKRGAITMDTLVKLVNALGDHTDYGFHVQVAVEVGALLRTIDNEADALETIRRIEAKANEAA